VPAELREGTGEVEAALDGRLPEDLITHRDIRGVVHSHSTWSDGKASLRQMAIAARARGMRYLTVTDHSQTAAYAGGLTPGRLRQQWKEIGRASCRERVEIWVGAVGVRKKIRRTAGR